MTQLPVAGQRSSEHSPTPIHLRNTVSNVDVIHSSAMGKHLSKVQSDNTCVTHFPATMFHPLENQLCVNDGLINNKTRQETKIPGGDSFSGTNVKKKSTKLQCSVSFSKQVAMIFVAQEASKTTNSKMYLQPLLKLTSTTIKPKMCQKKHSLEALVS